MRHRRIGSYCTIIAVLILVVLLIAAGTTAAQPPVPHGVMEGDDCLSCHQAGLAGAPRLSGDHVGRENEDCAICHEASGEFAGDVPHAVEGQEDCLSCHTEELETELGNSHTDYANEDCETCHRPGTTTTAEEEDTGDARAHIATGGQDCTSCHQLTFVEWSLDMACGEACHTMEPYVESTDNSEMLAYDHVEAGLACEDCHGAESLEEVHQDTNDPNVTEVATRKYEDGMCLDCHVDNQHASYEEIIERTAEYVINGEQINPHDPHATVEGDKPAGLECRLCHKMHKESSLVEACYGCHHERNFQNCSECHY